MKLGFVGFDKIHRNFRSIAELLEDALKQSENYARKLLEQGSFPKANPVYAHADISIGFARIVYKSRLIHPPNFSRTQYSPHTNK
jgi:hypothetical protein